MSEVDLTSSAVIYPSTIFPEDDIEDSRRVYETFQYLPFMKSFVFLATPQYLTFVGVDSNCVIMHSKQISIDEKLEPLTFAQHPEKNLIAFAVPYVYMHYESRIPAHVELARVPEHPSQMIRRQSTLFLTPHLSSCNFAKIKFFPDGSRLVVTYTNASKGAWCKIFTLPEAWEEPHPSDEWSPERWSVPVSSQTVPCEEIDVFEQGFPTKDPRVANLSDDISDDLYFELYNEQYYSSNIDGGFLCLAISPDTTRLLAGTNDAEVYVIDSITLKVLHCKREYGSCQSVTGCAFNPVHGHEEFAVCNELGIFDIWSVATCDDGSEEGSKVHHLKFQPGTSNCAYSPDGSLVALTSAAEFKTYVISSSFGNVMFTLCYKEQSPDNIQTYFINSSLFFGNSCQVATLHQDGNICLWQLPVIYSLKTLCLILLRASVKYNDTEKLCLPNSLKILLKYLYV